MALVVPGLRHMLSHFMVIKNITRLFSAAVLGVINMDVKITNNNYTKSIEIIDSSSAKSSKKVAQYLGGL